MLGYLKKIFKFVFSTADKRVACYIYILASLKKRKLRLLGLILSRRLQRRYGIFLPYSATFDPTLVLRHPVGIVVGEGAIIGKNVTVFQNVTLGRSHTNISEYPKIGNNTVIYSGAAVIGGVVIGENCIVGANSVVTKDVPANHVAVGAPARFFHEKT